MIGLLALGGCGFPAAGPTASQVERSADPALNIYVVKVSPAVAEIMSTRRTDGFPNSLRLASHSPSVALRPGDVIGISIYETGGSLLFGSAPQTSGANSGAAAGQPFPSQPTAAQSTTLPAQIVESDGQVLVPFAGRVLVAGRTPIQAADEIARRLSGQALKPQVIVTMVSNTANSAAVGGEVNKAGLVQLTLRGDRLLDVIAQAGGPRYSAIETDVRIVRGNTVAAIPLRQVMMNPADNIVVMPKDNVILVRNPKAFVVLGAATKVAQYNLDLERVTLAEAVARAGGPVDTYGNIGGIFLMRNEPTQLARAVIAADQNAGNSSFVQTDETGDSAGPQTRVIYRVDLTQAGGYFSAQNITLRDKDVVLIANAEATQVQKAMTLLRSFTGAYFDISRGATGYPPP